MMPQFEDEANKKINWENIYWGLILFSIGLAKKVIIADNLSPIVAFAFDKAVNLTFIEALVGSLSYSFQLYFDFSGYSDMAVGIALLFNIKLPFNFFSPYKATNIQDFWQRWHITLSRWLKQYIYIPLGGNKKGYNHTLVNLILTFLIGGIWHGANWTFVVWGAMHGVLIAAHRIWVKSEPKLRMAITTDSGEKIICLPKVNFSLSTKQNVFDLNFRKIKNIICTFAFVNFAWIFFRASNFGRVKLFIDGFRFHTGPWFREEFLANLNRNNISILILALFLVIAGKSSKEIYESGKASKWLSILSIILLILSIGYLLYIFATKPGEEAGEFIYFQF